VANDRFGSANWLSPEIGDMVRRFDSARRTQDPAELKYLLGDGRADLLARLTSARSAEGGLLPEQQAVAARFLDTFDKNFLLPLERRLEQINAQEERRRATRERQVDGALAADVEEQKREQSRLVRDQAKADLRKAFVGGSVDEQNAALLARGGAGFLP